MPARLPSDLLNRPAQESSRLLALSQLDQIDRAQRRLSRSQDREALHDFRVGLRRLRCSLRAYRVQLKGSVTGRMRTQIRQVARSTNDSRDTEVQLAWLRSQAEHLGAEETPGLFWLAGRLEGGKQEMHDQDTSEVARRYTRVSAKFRRALGILRIELDYGRGQRMATFGEVTGGLVRQQVARLRDDLTRIRGVSDVKEIHKARISGKRLRYMLEPIARRDRRAGALVRRLKEAQDLLGEHHDMHVLLGVIASLRTGIPESGFPGLEPGLATLARLAEERAAAAFERFHSVWGGDLAGRILTRADELGKSLGQPSSPPGNDMPGLAPQPSVSHPARTEVAAPMVTITG